MQRQETAEVLQVTVERLERHGIQASARAVIGDPTHEIVRTAELTDADLVVMSTHALAGPARSLFGSVAASVIREAGRPVLLVHRAARSAVLRQSRRVNATVCMHRRPCLHRVFDTQI